jgi:hypothetical protein
MIFTQINYLRGDDITLYQSYIGIIRWAIELGRIDIVHAGLTMANLMVAPWAGHLAAVVRIFAYIKKHLHSCIVFDPTERYVSNYGWIKAD